MSIDNAESRVRVRAVDGVSSVMAGIRGSLQTTQAALTSFASGFVGAFSVGAIATGMLASARATINFADQVEEMGQKVGVSTEALSKLAYAGEFSGLQVDSLGKGVKHLSSAMIEAGKDGSESAQIFKALGVDTKGGILPTIDQLADAFKELEDGELKAVTAGKLFGKDGMSWIPLLNEGSAGLKKARTELEEFGAVITTDFAKAAAQFNDNMTRMGAISKATGIALANFLMNSINPIIQGFIEAKRASLGFWETLAVMPGPGISSTDLLQAEEAKLAELQKRQAKLLADRASIADDTRAMMHASVAFGLKSVEADIAQTERRIMVIKRAQDALTEARMGYAGDLPTPGDKPKGRVNTAALRAALQGKEGGAAEKISDFQKLDAEISKAIALLDKEIEGVDKLTRAEQMRVEVTEKLRTGQIKLSGAERDRVMGWIDQLQVTEQLKRSRDEESKAQREALDMLIKEAQAVDDAIEKMRDADQQRRERVEEIGLEGDALIAVRNARIDATLAQRAEELATLEANDATSTRIRLLREEMESLRRAQVMNVEEAARTDYADKIKAEAEELRREAKSLEDAFADALMRGFERGGDSAKQLGDTLVNYFKSIVAKRLFGGIAESAAGAVVGLVNDGVGQLFGLFSGFAGDTGGANYMSDGATSVNPQMRRAKGGPVFPGRTYLVGEEGPELLRVPSPGDVVPAAASARMLSGGGGGSTHIVTTINPPARADHAWLSDVEARIERRILGTLQQSRRRGGVFAGT